MANVMKMQATEPKIILIVVREERGGVVEARYRKARHGNDE